MYDFSEVELAVFLSNVVNLFNDTLKAIYGISSFRFFMVVAVFLMVVSLLVRMLRIDKKGRL